MDDQFKVIFFTGRYKTYPENIEATLPIITESGKFTSYSSCLNPAQNPCGWTKKNVLKFKILSL